jgi:hypothetical protein
MTTTELTSQEVIALLPNESLRQTLSYLVDQCNGSVCFDYDGREDGCISDIYVYSECFTKADLIVLFNYAAYQEVVFSKKKQMGRIRLEMAL